MIIIGSTLVFAAILLVLWRIRRRLFGNVQYTAMIVYSQYQTYDRCQGIETIQYMHDERLQDFSGEIVNPDKPENN